MKKVTILIFFAYFMLCISHKVFATDPLRKNWIGSTDGSVMTHISVGPLGHGDDVALQQILAGNGMNVSVYSNHGPGFNHNGLKYFTPKSNCTISTTCWGAQPADLTGGAAAKLTQKTGQTTIGFNGEVLNQLSVDDVSKQMFALLDDKGNMIPVDKWEVYAFKRQPDGSIHTVKVKHPDRLLKGVPLGDVNQEGEFIRATRGAKNISVAAEDMSLAAAAKSMLKSGGKILLSPSNLGVSTVAAAAVANMDANHLNHLSNSMPGAGSHDVSVLPSPKMGPTEMPSDLRFLGYLIPFIDTPAAILAEQEANWRRQLKYNKDLMDSKKEATQYFSRNINYKDMDLRIDNGMSWEEKLKLHEQWKDRLRFNNLSDEQKKAAVQYRCDNNMMMKGHGFRR